MFWCLTHQFSNFEHCSIPKPNQLFLLSFFQVNSTSYILLFTIETNIFLLWVLASFGKKCGMQSWENIWAQLVLYTQIPSAFEIIRPAGLRNRAVPCKCNSGVSHWMIGTVWCRCKLDRLVVPKCTSYRWRSRVLDNH